TSARPCPAVESSSSCSGYLTLPPFITPFLWLDIGLAHNGTTSVNVELVLFAYENLSWRISETLPNRDPHPGDGRYRQPESEHQHPEPVLQRAAAGKAGRPLAGARPGAQHSIQPPRQF